MSDGRDLHEVSDLEDEYLLLGELGRGGSAVVYRAQDRALIRDVAIKVVRPKFAASAEDAVARLAREARTVARLQHPNIVTVHAVKPLRDGGLALVMQLVPGKTLKQTIQDDGPFAPDRAERVIKDVAEALAFAHAKGVVHRDVKPENIFIESGTGRALLSDFGIAHSTEYDSRLTMTGAAIGTPAYMSPEQIDGAPANARSDIYSLGLVAWEMLTGERPWEGEALYNVIYKQKTENLPAIDALRPGVVPPRLQYIVERMLQKKPSARWAGADGLLAALNHWVAPADWRQWEESHKKRKGSKKSTPVSKPAIKPHVDDATVRFARPADGLRPELESNVERVPAMAAAATATVAADDEDEAPSWAIEPVRSSRAWVWGMVGVLTVAAAGGAYAMFGDRMGSRASSVTATPALADRGNVEVPIVPPATDSVAKDSAAGVVLVDSLRRDSARMEATLSMATRDSMRIDSAATVRVQSRGLGVQRSAPSVGASAGAVVATAPAASTTPAPPVNAVRSTDDNGTIAAGGRHSCGVVGAKVFCWGDNDNGQLGDGDVESRETPVAIVGDLEFTQVTTGFAHSCAIARGGDAYCWGANGNGQLGDATTTARSAPVRVAGNANYRVLRAGRYHTCGITTGGDVTCWGANSKGQLGDGSASTRSSPVRVNANARFVSLSAGGSHTCAIAVDGVAYCWGDNAAGQLGNGTRGDARSPEPVAITQTFTSIAAGGTHSCAVSSSGEAYCWGSNSFGQLGVGNTTDQLAPSRVDGAVRFESITVGGVHSCARTRGGQAWCWGRNVYGQLGDDSNTNRDAPTRVVGGAAFATINATGAHTCATTVTGETTCWGYNVEGQLGDGSRNHHARPTRVTFTAR